MRPTVPLPLQFSPPDATSDGCRPTTTPCSAPEAIAELSGTWRGTMFAGGSGQEEEGEKDGTSFSLRQDQSGPDCAIVGRLAFNGSEQLPPAEVQLLEASTTTYVALVGPYFDPASNAQMLTLLEARRSGDRLYGTYRMRPVMGGRVTGGRFVAVRAAAELAA